MSSIRNNLNKKVVDSIVIASSEECQSHAKQKTMSPITRLESKMWKVFVQRQHEKEWARGCSHLREFVETEFHHSPSATSSSAAITEVDLDKWNKYWALYSDTYGSKLDALTAEFQCKTINSTENHNDRCSDENIYRRVLVSMRSTCINNTKVDTDNSNNVQTEAIEEAMHKYETYLRHVAHQLGAIESCSSAGRIFRVQFTTSLAACMFLSWANTLSICALDPLHSSSSEMHTCDVQNNTQSCIANEESVEVKVVSELPGTNTKERLEMSLELVARLAPCDLRVVSSVLQLGPNIRIPTAFVHNLFCNVFEAQEVTYMQYLDSFLIYFIDNVTAQTALHAAQSSLYHCFNLALTYYHGNA